jgi:hypothetical protein
MKVHEALDCLADTDLVVVFHDEEHPVTWAVSYTEDRVVLHVGKCRHLPKDRE